MAYRYFVVSARDEDVLAELVNKSLDRGWQLQGGMAVLSPADPEGIPKFFQAVVKLKE